jgi:long-subunit fatty acid transport protein
MTARRLVTLLALGAALSPLLVPPRATATNGTRPIAVGARAQGRGGVDIAIADDGTALATNPAGMAFIDGQRADQSLGAITPDITWSGPTDRAHAHPKTLPAASFGVVFDFQEPWHLGEVFTFEDEAWSELPARYAPDYDASPWKFGFGIIPTRGGFVDFNYATPFYQETQVGSPPRTLPEERLTHETIQQEVGVHLGVAYRFNEHFAIGISPSFLYSRIEIDKPITQPTSKLEGRPVDSADLTYADAAPFLGLEQFVGKGDMEDAETFGVRVKIGALFHVNDYVSLGVTYAPRSYLQDYLGRVNVDLNRQIDMVDPDGTLLKPTIAANTGIAPGDQDYAGSWNLRLKPQEIPQEVGLGIAVRLPRVTLGVDVHWINYSETFDGFEARLEDGNSAELNELTGDGRDTTKVEMPLEWDDQFVVAVGATVAVTDWLYLRAGYNFGRNPMPEEYLEPTIPAIFEHHITGGFSVFFKRLEISGAIEYALPVELEVDRHKFNSEYDGSKIEAELLWFGLGIGASF